MPDLSAMFKTADVASASDAASSAMLLASDAESKAAKYTSGTDTPSFNSVTCPTIIGGTATTSDLTLKTTTAAGETGADMHFLVGSNGGTEAMTILNNGNVGIGTIIPEMPLEVYGVGMYVKSPSEGIDGGAIHFGSLGGGNIAKVKSELYSLPFGYLKFYTNTEGGVSTERMSIDWNGNVGIGTIIANRVCEINSATGINLRLTYNDANGTAANYVDYLVTSGGNGTITPSGGLLTLAGNVQVTGHAYFDAEVDNGNSGAADTIDWTVGNKQKSTLTDNCTFTFTAPTGPCNLILKLVQDGTGSRTVTWPATCKWPSGSAPSLTTTVSATDIVCFYFDGTSYYGNCSFNFS